MNCGSCGKVMYATQTRCNCGWKKPAALQNNGIRYGGNCEHQGCPNPGTLSRNTYGDGGWLCSFHFFGENRKGSSDPLLAASRKKREEIDAYIRKNPASTKREACMTYLQEKGLVGIVPEIIMSESEVEARLEREAIQGQ